MKTRIRIMAEGQSGKILVMALVLLVVGGLLLTPLLGLMSTGLIAGQVYERKAAQLYAADAGVQDGIWKILNAEKAGLPGSPCGDEPWDYAYDMPEAVNENHVHVSMEYLGDGNHRIRSTATDEHGQTTVDSYITATLKVKDGEGWYDVLPGGTTYDGGNIEEGARIYVDGDLTMDDNIENPGTIVYVKGDLTMDGNIEDGAIVYVEGDLYLGGGIAEDSSIVCVGGDAWVPKVEDGAQLYVQGNLTVYTKEGLRGSGNIEDDDTVVCVGGQVVVEGEIEGNPTIHATESFDDCPISCWGCLNLETELVLEVASYQIGTSP